MTTTYTAKTNKHGQIDIIKTADADKPHAEARWYAGGVWSRMLVAMLPGETAQEAAERAAGERVPSRYRDTLEGAPVEWK